LILCVQTIEADHAIGPIHVVTDGATLIAMEFGDAEHRLLPMLRTRFGSDPRLQAVNGRTEITVAIRRYFEGDLEAIDTLAVDGGGTDFQRQAWAALRRIPGGETRTYGQMATALGRPQAARAIGSANALNPISLIVPCHRLVGTDGSLAGYGGGLGRKRWLLDHERRSARG
jgi:methylated-DNA-[protein]-cysteine S-methyltransferase